MANVGREALVGSWRHSHEEDRGGEAVYRRADFPFPPSRGRAGYELEADGTGTYVGIAARDGSARQPCQWRLGADGRELAMTLSSGVERSFRVVSIEPDRLVLSNQP
jgi:hypothetical protein